MNLCSSCQKQKAALECGLCHAVLCKKCTQFLEEDSFAFLKSIPEELTFNYCATCFEEKIRPQVDAYNEDMERAKDIVIFYKAQSKETRLLKRSEKPFKVEDCVDREETILRLAFFAVKAGFNAIIDVDLTSEKVIDGSYQTSKWRGTAVPVKVDLEKLNRAPS